METLLLNIVKEANGQKLATIRKAAQDAHGKYFSNFFEQLRLVRS